MDIAPGAPRNDFQQTIRPIQGIPNFFGIKFAPEEREVLVVKFTEGDRMRCRIINRNSGRDFSLNEYFENCKQDYKTFYPDMAVFPPLEHPVVLGGLAGYTWNMVLLGEGLVSVYSDRFIATFSRKFGRWFLSAVALEPGRYLSVKIGKQRYFAIELAWDGSGINSVRLFDKRHHQPAMPFAPQRLLPIRILPHEESVQLRELWMGTVTQTIYAEGPGHTFQFRAEEDFTYKWRLWDCQREAVVTDCFLGHDGLTFAGPDRIAVIDEDADIDEDAE